MDHKNRGAVGLVVVLAVAVVAVVGTWVAKPKILDGASKRAAASTEATANLEKVTQHKDALAAASITKIGEANANAPESKEKNFITREILVALGLLPAPDSQGLIDVEKRKVAVLEGNVAAINVLYDKALKESEKVKHERDLALAARQRADLDLETAAAEQLGAQRQRNQILLLAALAIGLFLYVKITHFSPGAMADVVNDIRNDVHPITAIDGAASRLQQKIVNFLARIKA